MLVACAGGCEIEIPSELCGPCQAFILLLAVLDIGKLMLVMREGGPLDAAAHRLGTASARESVNRELQTWGRPRAPHGGAPTMHAPLLLAWATFLCLSSSLTGDPGAVGPPCPSPPPPPPLVEPSTFGKARYPSSTSLECLHSPPAMSLQSPKAGLEVA